MVRYNIFSNPEEFYSKILDDISRSKKFVYIETYLFGNDPIGKKFISILSEKAKEGVEVKILIDAWGYFILSGRISKSKRTLFKPLIDAGGEVKFFREVQYTWSFFSKNNERDHRKLVIIDGKITYFGSYNITEKFIKNREIVLRIEEDITSESVKSFNFFWNSRKGFMKNLIHKEFILLQDFPSSIRKYTENSYVKLIKNAKYEINIETPYFIPSLRVRKAFLTAVRKGVKVRIILPKKSNWGAVDLIRNRYLGYLHRAGVNIYYYLPKLLHSKLLIVDNKFFLLGSSNLDYRSFRYNYEINLFGKNRRLVKLIHNHFNDTLMECEPFDYNKWKKRSNIKKFLELILYKIRRLF